MSDKPLIPLKRYDPNNLPEGIYLWLIDSEETSRLSSLLETNFPALGVKGHFVDGRQIKCTKCGKKSGLDDFVYTALKEGVHTREHMIETLTKTEVTEEEAARKGHSHLLVCCVCDIVFADNKEGGYFGWPMTFGWYYNGE